MAAGHHTSAADPLPHTLKGYRSDPSISAMPRGTFLDGKVSFRLQTPLDRGICVQVGIFRPPETHPFKVVADQCGGNFARGRGAFGHYCHMQQQAKYLVPSLPCQSRVDELNRMNFNARRHEFQRSMTLDSMEFNHQRKMSRLRDAKSLLQSKSLSKEIGQQLQLSCSLPDLNDPCGEQTGVFQLLNRRVDVNKIKKCRSQLLQQQKAVVVRKAVTETPELKELLDDIRRFEDDNLPELNMILESAVDWRNCSSTVSFGQKSLASFGHEFEV